MVEILQLQYTDEKVDFTAESSEDGVDDVCPVHREAGLMTLYSCGQVPAVQVQQRTDASDSGPSNATEW